MIHTLCSRSPSSSRIAVPRAVFAALALSLTFAQARPEYGFEVPHSEGASRCIHCHTTNSNPEKRNVGSFGNDWFSNGRKWDKALADFDSDGDGESNGVELGDPCAEWSKGATPLYENFSSPSSEMDRSGNPSCGETPEGGGDGGEAAAGTWFTVQPASSAAAWEALGPIEQIATARNADIVALGNGWNWATDGTFYYGDLYPYLYNNNTGTWLFYLVDSTGLYCYDYGTELWTWFSRDASGGQVL